MTSNLLPAEGGRAGAGERPQGAGSDLGAEGGGDRGGVQGEER